MNRLQLLGGISSGAMVFTALGHSAFGELRIVQPLLRIDSALTRSPLVRFLIRLAWHFLSALMVATAVLVWGATHIGSVPGRYTLIVLGITWAAAGVVSLIGSRGRHIGWPAMLLAGACALISTT